MNTIEEQKGWAVSRIEEFLGKLKEATNPFDIEAQTYTIMRTAEASFEKMHKTNSDVRS